MWAKTKSVQVTHTHDGFTLTEVAVGRHWHQVGVREMLVSDLVGAVVVHLHVHQSLVPLLHSYHACREGGRRDVQNTLNQGLENIAWPIFHSYPSSYKLQVLQTPHSGSLW